MVPRNHCGAKDLEVRGAGGKGTHNKRMFKLSQKWKRKKKWKA